MTPVHISLGGYQPATSVHTRAVDVFCRDLRDTLGDDVTLAFEPDVVALGQRATELPRLVESGETTIAYFSTSYFATRIAEFALLDLPFAFAERDQAWAVLDGAFGARLARLVREETGFHILGWWDNGFRHLSNRVRPIHRPADCRGLTIRVMPVPAYEDMFAALGFEPVALDVRDMLAAIDAGTIDAQENPLTNYLMFGIHKAHPHITLTGHTFGTASLVCNAAVYDGWPAGLRAAVDRAAAEATRVQREIAAREDDNALADLKAAAAQVVELDPAERQAFETALAPLADGILGRFSTGLRSAFLEPAAA